MMRPDNLCLDCDNIFSGHARIACPACGSENVEVLPFDWSESSVEDDTEGHFEGGFSSGNEDEGYD